MIHDPVASTRNNAFISFNWPLTPEILVLRKFQKHLVITIVVSANLVFVFFFFPETQCRRPVLSISDIPTNSGAEPTNEKFNLQIIESSEQPSSLSRPKKSCLQQLSPFSGINPGQTTNPSFLFLLIRAWPLTLYPAVIYAFLVFGFNLACILFVVSTATVIFQFPPYNFSPPVSKV